MLIAIDFDDTLTLDPVFWRQFILLCRSNDHRIVIVTARVKTLESQMVIQNWCEENLNSVSIGVWFTSHGSKTDYMMDRGIKVDVWIDDNPRTCALGH